MQQINDTRQELVVQEYPLKGWTLVAIRADTIGSMIQGKLKPWNTVISLKDSQGVVHSFEFAASHPTLPKIFEILEGVAKMLWDDFVAPPVQMEKYECIHCETPQPGPCQPDCPNPGGD